MSDLISRQAVLDALEESGHCYHFWIDIENIIESLPSAEPNLQQTCNQLATTSGDLISRQDAVNEIHKYFVAEIDKTPTEIDEDGNELYADMPTVNSLLACNKELSKRIKSLPSAESTGAMDEAIQKYIKDGYMQPIGEDLINRQDAIRWVKTECNPYGKPTLEFESGKKVIEHLEKMPSADRPTGEWVRKYDGHINCYWYECDQCGEYRPRNQFGHEYNANFCPNCGADMRGEEE